MSCWSFDVKKTVACRRAVNPVLGITQYSASGKHPMLVANVCLCTGCCMGTQVQLSSGNPHTQIPTLWTAVHRMCMRPSLPQAGCPTSAHPRTSCAAPAGTPPGCPRAAAGRPQHAQPVKHSDSHLIRLGHNQLCQSQSSKPCTALLHMHSFCARPIVAEVSCLMACTMGGKGGKK